MFKQENGGVAFAAGRRAMQRGVALLVAVVDRHKLGVEKLPHQRHVAGLGGKMELAARVAPHHRLNRGH